MDYSTMAKKISVADMKAGRVFRCGHCDAKCDDEIELGSYDTGDLCLGRIDSSKIQTTYFCSMSCYRYKYLENMMINISQELNHYTIKKNTALDDYREAIESGENPKPLLNFIVMLKSVIHFYKGCIEKIGEYALHERRLKANKYIGDFMEYYHDSSTIMDFATNTHKKINDVDIEYFM